MRDTCSIRIMSEEDLPLVLAWRNHPQISQFMFNKHDITKEEHLAWFTKATLNPSQWLLIVQKEDEAFGFVQLSVIDEGRVAKWGFYVRPGASSGSGRLLGKLALDYAFDELRLCRIYSEVIEENEVSISFHRSLGFHLEGILRAHKLIDGIYKNLHCYGLLSHEWQSKI